MNSHVAAFQGSQTHDLFVSKFDPDTGEQVVNLRILKEPENPEWGLILGDMVHNLRSALDHLVWQLVLLNGEKPRRQNQFPIIGTEPEYWEVAQNRSESVRDRMLAGVSETHRAFIDVIQPFNRGDETMKTALSLLSTISNADKHRVVYASLALVGKPSKDDFQITSDQPGAALDVSMNWGEVKDGAEVVRIRPDPPGAKVKVDATLPLHIAFRQGGFDLGTDHIELIFSWVSDYVRGFAPIFDGELRMGEGSPIRQFGPVPGS